MISCKFCDYNNDDGLVFCFACGRRLSSSPVRKEKVEKTKAEKPRESAPVKSVFTGKDFTNQSISANLFKSANDSLGGKIS